MPGFYFLLISISLLLKYLGPEDDFPPVESANRHGLLAFGGDLSAQRLIKAYSSGIFPWFDPSQPILWWSPDPRMVLFPEKLRISKSMKQVLKKGLFSISYNQKFEEVIHNCAIAPREGQEGTWITPAMEKAYLELKELGFALSVEVWEKDLLVGGLYGVYLREKKVFCGESMFSKRSNASKFGFIKLVQKLQAEGVQLVDCQIFTPHLESLGAEEIARKDFLKYLQ